MRIYKITGIKALIISIAVILIILVVLVFVLQIILFLLPIILLIGALAWLFSLFKKRKKVKRKEYIDIKAKVK